MQGSKDALTCEHSEQSETRTLKKRKPLIVIVVISDQEQNLQTPMVSVY